MAFTLPESNLALDIDFDPEHLRERSAVDKQKRIRPDQLAQFQGLSDVLEVDDSDPFSEPIHREPVTEELDTLVLGGGFGGTTAGAYLAQNEVSNSRIVEYGGDFGGTWYWNRYPGVQCDAESHIYMPLLEETGYAPASATPTAPRSSSTPSASVATTTSTTRPTSRPAPRTRSGTSRRSAGRSPPTAATGSAPGSSCVPTAR